MYNTAMRIEEVDEFPFAYDPEAQAGIAQKVELKRARRVRLDRLHEITLVKDGATGHDWYSLKLESGKGPLVFLASDCSRIVAQKAKLGDLVTWNEAEAWFEAWLVGPRSALTVTVARINMKVFFRAPGTEPRRRSSGF